MSKRFMFIAGGLLLLTAAVILIHIFDRHIDFDYVPPEFRHANTDAEIYAAAVKAHQLGSPTPAVAAVQAPLNPNQPVRLAIGGLGLADNDQNQQLGDLITVELTGAPGFNLVERQSLAAILHELNLSFSGFVRANDAVRVGKLLKADWFLLGTEVKIKGTNSLVVRVVDVRSGIMRDAGVIAANQSPTKLAAEVAVFVRQSRQNATLAKIPVYLAIGAFEDLSVNNRQADFPTQLRGYLTAAYQGGSVTLLEREYVDTLLQEVQLDLAGLTEEGGTNPPPPMQSAFWLVSGQYQSYETTNLQVELNLDVQRIFGTTKHFTVRNLPVEPVGLQIKTIVDEVLNEKNENVILTRWSEAKIQMAIGKDLSQLGAYMGDQGLVWVDGKWDLDPQLAAKLKRNLEQAMRAFETVLLLEPTNHEAKMYLAACLRIPVIYRWDEARNYYREIIDEPIQDKWTGLAQQAIGETFRWTAPEEKHQWYDWASQQTTNSSARNFYKQQAEAAAIAAVIKSGDGTNAIALAEKQLLVSIRSAKDVMEGKSGTIESTFGMWEFSQTFGDNNREAADHLVKFLPRMKTEFPDFTPYLLAAVVTMQPDTNSPVVSEFEQALDECVAHPKQVFKIQEFWMRNKWTVYDWCFEKTNYALAVKLMEGEQHASIMGDADDFSDQEKIKLAYAYLATKRWQDALAIFEGFTNRPVRAETGGPWGAAFKPILTDKMASYCRQKLGTVAAEDTRVFDMGKPVLCMHTPSAFIADDNGVWVGITGQLLHLDFDLKTNLAVRLPIDDSIPITALCVTSSNIWIGTRGAGLIEFDKTSHECSRLTEADGLLMNDLASLEVAGDSLWIGYGGATGGGLGRLDLRSQKLISFMPSLNTDATAQTGEMPAREPISKITAINNDELLLFVPGGIRKFHVTRGVWGTFPNKAGDWVSAFSADSAWFVEAGGNQLTEIIVSDKPKRNAPTNEVKKTNMVVTSAELSQLNASLQTNGSGQFVSSVSSGRLRPRGSLAIQNLRDHRWQNLVDVVGLPNPPSTLTLDGNNLWVGGEGAIALVDMKEAKVRKFCHIKAAGVDCIQIGGGYVWAQFDSHLYRAPLNDIQ